MESEDPGQSAGLQVNILPSSLEAHTLDFSPNPCPDLKEKVISHGSWECQKSKEKKFCKNDRTGDICELECKRSKVRRQVRLSWD